MSQLFTRLAIFALLFCQFPITAWARHSRKAPAATADAGAAELRAAETALAAHDLSTAEQQLVQAYRRTRSAEVLYLLGVVARERRNLVAAQDYWRRYLASPSIEPDSPHAQEAQQLLTQRHDPAGELYVVGEEGALVFVDEHLVGAVPLPLPLLLSAGSHKVVLELGRKVLPVQLQIADGRGAEVRFVADYDALLVSVPPAVLVLPTWNGPTLPTQRRLLQEAQQAIRRANHAVFDTETALAHSPEQRSCLAQKSCQLALAARSEIEFVLAIAVTAPAAGSGDYKLAAELHAAQIAVPAASGARDCAACTAEQAASKLAELVEQTVQKGAGRGRGTLEVSSSPPGAEIRLGSTLLGKTPAKLSLWSGDYQLALSLPGGPPTPVQAAVSDGKTEQVAATLVQPEPAAPRIEPAAPPPPRPARRPRWRLVTGGIAVGVGLFMLGNGVAAAAIDGTCVLGPSSPPMCPGGQYYDTQAPAIGLLSAGAAVTLTGVILLAVPGKRP